jgi:hypothetical protein
MKLLEIVQAARTSNERFFGNVPDNRAAAIARGVLQEIGKQIEATSEGRIAVGGFGHFVIKQVQREQAGQKVLHKRVLFLAAKPATQEATARATKAKTKR